MPDDKLEIPITPSMPPAERLIAARGMAWQLVIAQLAELIALMAFTFALCSGKLSEQMYAALCGYCLTGNLAQKIRGKVPLPTTAVVASAFVWLFKAAPFAAIARHTVLAVTLALTLSGCARNSYEPDWVLVHNTANTMRTEVAKLVEKAKPAKPAIELFCQVVPSSPQCDQARAVYDAASTAVEAFNGAVDVYEQVGLGAERVESAINAVYAAMQALERQTAALTEAMHAILEDTGGGGSPAPAKPAAPAPGRSAPIPAGRGKPAPAPAPAQGTAANPAGSTP